jgi:hypothetical protein
MSTRRDLTEEEIESRKTGWQRLWRKRFLDEVCLMPAHHQGRVNEMLKRAFYEGTNYERRRLLEPMQVGGID